MLAPLFLKLEKELSVLQSAWRRALWIFNLLKYMNISSLNKQSYLLLFKCLKLILLWWKMDNANVASNRTFSINKSFSECWVDIVVSEDIVFENNSRQMCLILRAILRDNRANVPNTNKLGFFVSTREKYELFKKYL